MVGFCNLLGTLYAPVSKIPSIKLRTSNLLPKLSYNSLPERFCPHYTAQSIGGIFFLSLGSCLWVMLCAWDGQPGKWWQRHGGSEQIGDGKHLKNKEVWPSFPVWNPPWLYASLVKNKQNNHSAKKVLTPLCNTEHWRHFLSFFRIVPLGRALCMGWATGEVAAAAARRRRQ